MLCGSVEIVSHAFATDRFRTLIAVSMVCVWLQCRVCHRHVANVWINDLSEMLRYNVFVLCWLGKSFYCVMSSNCSLNTGFAMYLHCTLIFYARPIQPVCWHEHNKRESIISESITSSSIISNGNVFAYLCGSIHRGVLSYVHITVNGTLSIDHCKHNTTARTVIFTRSE